jgi:hypothetical protein
MARDCKTPGFTPMRVAVAEGCGRVLVRTEKFRPEQLEKGCAVFGRSGLLGRISPGVAPCVQAGGAWVSVGEGEGTKGLLG